MWKSNLEFKKHLLLDHKAIVKPGQLAKHDLYFPSLNIFSRISKAFIHISLSISVDFMNIELLEKKLSFSKNIFPTQFHWSFFVLNFIFAFLEKISGFVQGI